MTRILHILDSFEIGGQETCVLRLAKAQSRAGHDVQVTALFRAGALRPEFEHAGIPTDVLDKREGLDWRALRRLRTSTSRKRPEVIHSHNAVAHYYAALATLGMSIRRINTRHDMGEHLRGWRREWLYRATMPSTHAVVAVCEAAERTFVDSGIVPKRLIRVIHNGVDPCSPTNAALRDEARRRLGVKAVQGLVVGAVGRLHQVKRYDVLIAAWRIVGQVLPNATLVIVGDGPERARLEVGASSITVGTEIRFAGMREDVRDLLPAFDVLVSTSDTEGMSVALVEACWAGLPIVATQVGGNAEIVSNEVNGLLVPRRNPQALASALSSLLNDSATRARYGAQSRLRAVSMWDVDAMRAAYDTVYANSSKA